MSSTASTSRISVIISRCFGANHRPDIDVSKKKEFKLTATIPLAFSSTARVSRAYSFFPPDSIFVSTVTAYKSIRVAHLCRWPPWWGINTPAVPSCWPQFSQIQPVIHLIWDQVENGSCHRDFIDGYTWAERKRAPVSVRQRTRNAPSLLWYIFWTQRSYQLLIISLM